MPSGDGGSLRRAARRMFVWVPACSAYAALILLGSLAGSGYVEARPVAIDDIATLRSIERLEISPDKKRYAIFLRRNDPQANEYRTGLFVGNVGGDKLLYVGDGGLLRPDAGGNFSVDIRWSADGRWIACARRDADAVQLWVSDPDSGAQTQITHNAGDVREFFWSDDSQALYFTAGASRAALRAFDEAKERAGYQYDEDLTGYHEFLLPTRPRNSGPAIDAPRVWVVTLQDRREHLASDVERTAFELARDHAAAGRDSVDNAWANASMPPVKRADGAFAQLVRSSEFSYHLHLTVTNISGDSSPITCADPRCSGRIERTWWSEDGQRVLFLRKDGLGSGPYGGSGGFGVYAWSPATGAVATLFYTFDHLQQCSPGLDEQLICIRDAATLPPHVAAVDLGSGHVEIIADVNPRFRAIDLGRAERFEWDTPAVKLAEVYPTRAHGYLLYPPEFDASKKYPVFIEPYVASGFNSSGGGEHALPVYAANGFVVLNTAFPSPQESVLTLLGEHFLQKQYSPELGFPHLTLMMESTVRGLKVVESHGFIDERRVGIGGVSQGSFVPMYMLQKHDLISAISISSQGWSAQFCYSGTLKARRASQAAADFSQPGCEESFWSQIDPADHVEAIEAPVLMNLPAAETPAMTRLLRHLADAHKPYDAYVFPNELHIKWQPAHLLEIQIRNLDWFRFWLQGYEDPAPQKKAQYSRWRDLRKLQRHNMNSSSQLDG